MSRPTKTKKEVHESRMMKRFAETASKCIIFRFYRTVHLLYFFVHPPPPPPSYLNSTSDSNLCTFAAAKIVEADFDEFPHFTLVIWISLCPVFLSKAQKFSYIIDF